MSQNPYFETNLGALVGQVGKVMSRALMDKFKKKGYEFGIDQWIVMIHLWHEDGQTQQRLGEIAGRNKTTVTRAIDWLEKNDFVVRVNDQLDRRNKRIYLTNGGKQLQHDLIPEVSEVMTEATHGIPEDDLESCKKVMRTIFRNLKAYI
ncbi:MAG: MarR family winged helix-turn-helix transcriptional regulator [Bacteroidia bacterium]|nr:MarR family winged helix-turn-helix transcriptional regulator [Bacteroidia bacterium]